ncbi:MAG: MATE family efflux transporter [Clostridia bacterium]|nr:MATE family efflux transporter [Clostridia bacterium]
MQKQDAFRKSLFQIALPVTLQSLLQSSFSVVDQLMIGQLGSVSIAGIGLGGKFAGLFSVLVSAVAAVAGIMIAQHLGKKDLRQVGRSFYLNLIIALIIAVVFGTAAIGLPEKILSLYTKDQPTIEMASVYLRIYALGFLPAAVTTILSTLLRCMDAAVQPLYASIAAAVVNSGLNYILIFGKLGFPAMGTRGAALATVISQVCGCAITLIMFWRMRAKRRWNLPFSLQMDRSRWKHYAGILAPILVCEFFWSLGENVYASIYGHIGTQACAAMTLTNPIQALTIGALSGVAQASGIMVGKSLGAGEYQRARQESKKLMLCGFFGSLVLSASILIFAGYYVKIFQVEDSVRLMTINILMVYAVISPVKVQNMILGGGILRSGGRTEYVMYVDLIGTWIFGVPLGALSAFVLHQPIHIVYLMLSLEECVRLLISLAIFRRNSWMRSLGEEYM